MRRNLALITSSILLASCGGGDNGNGGNPAPTFTVSATVSGLPTGTTLVLANNGGNNTSVSTNGTIGFSTPIASGGSYAVTVATQPTGATCTVANGSGTISNANVNVGVTCTLNSYTVGGTVAGLLAGNSVTLQNNAADNTTVSANGAFTFSSSILSGSAYAVTVLTQPTGQTCEVTGGSGTVTGSNISNVAVNCSTLSYPVNVTVAGPPSVAGLTIQNHGGESISVTTGGTYTFQAQLPSRSAYAVTLSSQPAGQTCFVVNGSGSVVNNAVNVAVSCPWHIAYVSNQSAPAPNELPNGVAAYYIDATTGLLNPVAGSPFAVGIEPADLEIAPSGNFIYVLNDKAVSVYAIDATSGALTEIAGSPFASGNGDLRSIVINPAGSFAYAADPSRKVVHGFSINSTSGALTAVPGSPFTDLNPPSIGGTSSVTIDPSGAFVYVGTGGSISSLDHIVTAAVDPATGSLTYSSGINGSSLGQVTSITVDATGRYVYSTSRSSRSAAGPVTGYSRDAGTGALTPLAGSPFDIEAERSSFVIGPDGRFAYAPGFDDVRVYSIDGTSGALAAIAGSPFAAPGTADPPAGTNTLSIDPSGTFALTVRNSGIAVYRIDDASGALTAVTGSPFATQTMPIAIAIK